MVAVTVVAFDVIDISADVGYRLQSLHLFNDEYPLSVLYDFIDKDDNDDDDYD